MSARTGRIELLVPSTAALVFTAERGWYLAGAPPAWWLEELDAASEPTE